MHHVEDLKTSRPVIAFVAAAENGADLPALYATLKHDFSGRGKDGSVKVLLKGQRVRVTNAGRFGDVGVTTDLDETKHYDARATLAEMSDYSDIPGER